MADDPWPRFLRERRDVLEAWIDAERALASARVAGQDDAEPGDRLLAAEARLQTAIVDWAAVQAGAAGTTTVALRVLRGAEAMLEAELGLRARRSPLAAARKPRGRRQPRRPASPGAHS